MRRSLEERFAVALQCPEPEVARILTLIVRAIVWTLDETRALRLPGLGTFSVRETQGRLLGRNPLTGEPIKMPAKTIVFRPDETEGAEEDRPDLVARLARSLECSTDEATRLWRMLATVLKGAIVEEGEVVIPAFGTIRSHADPPALETSALYPDAALLTSIHKTSELPPELRPPRSSWKSSAELAPEDFEAHPLWGYDLARGESEPGADESFVRPYECVEHRADFSTTYFAHARITSSSGEHTSGSLSFHFEAGDVILDQLRVNGLEPLTVPLGIRAVGPFGTAAMEPFRDRFPLRYEAHVPAADGTVVDLVGEVDPFRQEPEPVPDPDAYDLRTGFEGLLWTDDEAAVRRRYPEAKADSALVGIPAPSPMLAIADFLEVEGVTLDATVFFGPKGIITISIAPPLGGPDRDLAMPKATLARRLGGPERLRSFNRWMSAGCIVDFVTHDGGHFACVIRPPSFLA